MAELLSVGLDVGTTTTQLIASRLTVENRASAFAVPKMEITRREIRYRSPVHFTPLKGECLVDGEKIRELVMAEYAAAGITRADVDEALQLGNCLINSFHFRQTDIQTGWATMEQSADGIAYAKAKGVKLYQAQVAQGVDLEKLIEAGYCGAQLRFVPEFTQHTNGAKEKNENSNSF